MMKAQPLIPILLILPAFAVHGQEQRTKQAEIPVLEAVEARYEIQSSHTSLLGDGTNRKVIMQRVKPLVLPPPPEPLPVVPLDPVVRAARRAAWLLEAKKEHRLVSLTGIYYPNGQTFLQWFTLGKGGGWESYEAWTLTDFRSAWLVQQFEVGNTVYDIFPSVHPASKWDKGRAFPGPLYFPEGSPGFRISKGDPTNTKAIEPIAALHEIYRQDGQKLTAQWMERVALNEAETARLKANPPPVEDIVIQVFPFKSNIFPEAQKEYEAAKAAGIMEAKAIKTN